MKVLFVDNLLLKRENDSSEVVLQPHLGLISLISVLENAGYEGALYDPKLDIASGRFRLDNKLYYQIARKILDQAPDVVGFTSLGCNFICTAKIAGYIRRELPDIPILLGGPHATVLDKPILSRFGQFDLIVRNEAEMKIVPVLKSLESRNFSDIPGVSYRKDGMVVANPGDDIIEDLDILPLPAYHAYPIKDLGLRSLRVEAGRGCPFKCTFCSTATFFGRRYRLKSSRVLAAELDFLYREYGIDDFSLNHDLFTVNRRKVEEFCLEVMDRNYRWKCSARMDCVDKELLSQMRRSGCRSIYYGIETGSRAMQDISQKKLDLDIFDDTLNETLDLGIVPTVSFITGYPQERLQDQNDTLDLVGKCLTWKTSIDLNVQLHLLTPEPGTALMHEFGDKMGFDNHISDFNFPTLEDDDADVMQGSPGIFMNHHYFKSILPRERNIFVTTLFELLSPLGKEVRQHLLLSYADRLSQLAEELLTFVNAAYGDAILNQNRLLRFLEGKFPDKAYLVSLVRYMYQLKELSLGHGPADTGPGADEKGYRLNHNVRLVRSTHNCPKIIERLRRDQRLSDSLLTRRINLVLQLVTDQQETFVKNYYIDRTLARLIEAAGDESVIEDNPSIFKDLCEAGILVGA